MLTSAGIDVGTRGIRVAYGRCPYVSGYFEFSKGDIEEVLRFLKGMGVKELCIAGGYQWREIKGDEILSKLYDEVVPNAGEEETHGFRRLLANALLYFEVRLLPSAGASGEVPEGLLINALDTGTPDKVAKVNYLIYNGINTFTLIDKGCFVSILYVEDRAITKFVSATRGMPGRCSPGLVDVEMLLLFRRWPENKMSILRSGVEDKIVETWMDFYRPTFVGEEVVCPSERCGKYSGALGAFMWCCGYKPKHLFSDYFIRWITLRD